MQKPKVTDYRKFYVDAHKNDKEQKYSTVTELVDDPKYGKIFRIKSVTK